MSKPEITVVIPTIPPRRHLLERALESVKAQTLLPQHVIVNEDRQRHGAAITRQRALEQAKTDWVAFLDDDDEFKPGHLSCLAAAAQETGADYVYSWYDVVGGTDPRPEQFGQQFDPCNPTQTTITTLVRTELAQEAGFLPDTPDTTLRSPDRYYAGEDWLFTRRCNDLGAYIFHTPFKTWKWWHWGGNTSGLPDRWTDTEVSMARVDNWVARSATPRPPQPIPQPDVVFPR